MVEVYVEVENVPSNDVCAPLEADQSRPRFIDTTIDCGWNLGNRIRLSVMGHLGGSRITCKRTLTFDGDTYR